MSRPAVSDRSLRRRYPNGAEVQTDGVAFRVWAPKSRSVHLQLANSGTVVLEREPNGYWSCFVSQAGSGSRYSFLLDARGPFPDPASRFQPEGPDAPSEVIDASAFQWSDGSWTGVKSTPQVIYELHIGTFTREGTWRAATEHLPHLAELGITMLEVMPIAEFAGTFGWGYDGVDLFAPYHGYGRPDDMRSFVDRAHALGLAVILDVVYNHFGPAGCHLHEFSPDYFTTRYKNEWGEPVNFDGPHSEVVREFFLSNTQYWLEEYHLDGLRLDATQQIFDASKPNIIQEIGERTRKAGAGRRTFVVAENEPEDSTFIRSIEEDGYALDALWNDDFHHSVVVATTGIHDAYLSDHQGTPQELISAARHGFLFQGQFYSWQKQPRGTPSRHISPSHLVHFLDNHDQVANIRFGKRLHQLTSPGRWRTATALLLLGPQTPMLFQGEEFASSTPFLYFADHEPELAMAVAKGRADFISQFPAAAAARASLPMPHDRDTFERCRLDWSELRSNNFAVALHKDLIALRMKDPVFSTLDDSDIDGAVIAPEAFILRYSATTGERLLIFNFGIELRLASIAEPLMAPPAAAHWREVWSSEEVGYGGGGAAPLDEGGPWRIAGHSATVLKAGRL